MNYSNKNMRHAAANQTPEPPIEKGQMNRLLGEAGKRLGKDPGVLKQQIETGQINQALSGLDPQTAARVSHLLNSPEELQRMLDSPKVQKMLGMLMGKQ